MSMILSFIATNRHTEIMVNSSNKIDKHIQLNNKVSFLNLTVTLISNKLEFDIYKKPTQTDFIILYDDNQPFTQNN